MNIPQVATTNPHDYVRLERVEEGAIAILTLDDPARTNAMSAEMGDALSAHVDATSEFKARIAKYLPEFYDRATGAEQTR